MWSVSIWLAAAAASTVLGGAATPRARAERTPSPPVLDGRLDDPVWQRARWQGGFTQKFPDEAAPPSEVTSFRVLYDDEAFYVAVECEQLHTPVRAVLTRRDRQVEADRVSVHIGSRQGEASAFQFGVNAAGVLSDALQFDDNRTAPEWDENWEAATSQHARGWSAELRIPLRVLRFEGAVTQDWAFNVRRVISLRQEIDEWAFIPRIEAGEVSRYGRVENLENLRARRRIELRPFVLGRVSHWQPGFAPVSGFRPGAAAGIDLKWQVLPQLTVEATALPDFGQVELDQVVLNLSTVETFYPEKRPFFGEGLDLFATPLTLLHTRRIGETPDSPSLPPGDRAADLLEPAPIYGAFKLTGRAAARLDLGIISAVTGETALAVTRPDGSTARRLAAPLTSYNVLRLRQRIGTGTRVGLLATAVNRWERRSNAHAYPTVAGPEGSTGPAGDETVCPGGARVTYAGEGAADCFHDGYVGAVDGYWRSASGDYMADGQVALSLMHGGQPRLFPDGTWIRSGDLDREFRFQVRKEGGEHWLAEAWASSTGRRFDRNDIGFMRRQSDFFLGGSLTYRTTRPFAGVLETRTGPSLSRGMNLDGLLLQQELELASEWKLRNFWTVGLNVHHQPTRFQDREVGDGTSLEFAPIIGGALVLDSDPRRAVETGLRALASLRRGGEGGGQIELDGRLLVRALPQLDLELLPSLRLTRGETRFAGRGLAGEPVFGRLEASALGATMRGTYTFTPTLSVQSYLQLFLAHRDYDRYRSLTPDPTAGGKRRIHLRDLQIPALPVRDPELREAILNVNLVLRWEYHLGSTIFLVYTRVQNALSADPWLSGPQLDLGALKRAPAADTLLLKISRWWG
jgi:hypothetical protein